MNCCVVPWERVGFDGDRVINRSSAGVTDSTAAFEVIPSKDAVMFVVPSARAVARPADPAALLIVAIEVSLEVQVTDAVMSSVVLPPL